MGGDRDFKSSAG